MAILHPENRVHSAGSSEDGAWQIYGSNGRGCFVAVTRRSANVLENPENRPFFDTAKAGLKKRSAQGFLGCAEFRRFVRTWRMDNRPLSRPGHSAIRTDRFLKNFRNAVAISVMLS